MNLYSVQYRIQGECEHKEVDKARYAVADNAGHAIFLCQSQIEPVNTDIEIISVCLTQKDVILPKRLQE